MLKTGLSAAFVYMARLKARRLGAHEREGRAEDRTPFALAD